jgi:hypothetical protein
MLFQSISNTATNVVSIKDTYLKTKIQENYQLDYTKNPEDLNYADDPDQTEDPGQTADIADGDWIFKDIGNASDVSDFVAPGWNGIGIDFGDNLMPGDIYYKMPRVAIQLGSVESYLRVRYEYVITDEDGIDVDDGDILALISEIMKETPVEENWVLVPAQSQKTGYYYYGTLNDGGHYTESADSVELLVFSDNGGTPDEDPVVYENLSPEEAVNATNPIFKALRIPEDFGNAEFEALKGVTIKLMLTSEAIQKKNNEQTLDNTTEMIFSQFANDPEYNSSANTSFTYESDDDAWN